MPTATEQGLDVEVYQYRFMTTPKGTPQDVKDAIWEGMQATFETEDYQAFNEQNSLTPMEVSGDEVVEALEEDKQRYADLVEQYGIDLAELTGRRHLLTTTRGADDDRDEHEPPRPAAGRTSWPSSRPRWPRSWPSERPPAGGPAYQVAARSWPSPSASLGAVLAYGYGLGSLRRPGPGLWPFVVSRLIIVLSVVLLVVGRTLDDSEQFSRSSVLAAGRRRHLRRPRPACSR